MKEYFPYGNYTPYGSPTSIKFPSVGGGNGTPTTTLFETNIMPTALLPLDFHTIHQRKISLPKFPSSPSPSLNSSLPSLNIKLAPNFTQTLNKEEDRSSERGHETKPSITSLYSQNTNGTIQPGTGVMNESGAQPNSVPFPIANREQNFLDVRESSKLPLSRLWSARRSTVSGGETSASTIKGNRSRGSSESANSSAYGSSYHSESEKGSAPRAI